MYMWGWGDFVFGVWFLCRERSVTVPHSEYSPFRTLNIHRSVHGNRFHVCQMIYGIYSICYWRNGYEPFPTLNIHRFVYGIWFYICHTIYDNSCFTEFIQCIIGGTVMNRSLQWAVRVSSKALFEGSLRCFGSALLRSTWHGSECMSSRAQPRDL